METSFKFSRDRPFQQELQARVERHLAVVGRTRYGGARLFLKVGLLYLWAGLSYAGLVTAAHWWQALPFAVSLGLVVAALGFNVGHDGNHGAGSPSKAVNRALGWTLDLLGGSSYVWRFKHNVLHHSYPNVDGLDDDIDLGGLCRMSRHQPHRPYHRLQHLYMWGLYSLITPKWHLYDDFVAVARGHIGGHRFPRPKGADLALFVAGKLAFFSWALILPALFHPLPVVLLFYAVVSSVQGIVLSIVFQLAHLNEEAESFSAHEVEAATDREWAIHQIETTANFGQRNRLLTWYVGGLNHQIEHHLFPRISHVHLPGIAKIVEDLCRERGVRYHAHPTMGSAVLSHHRCLRSLGAAP